MTCAPVGIPSIFPKIRSLSSFLDTISPLTGSIEIATAFSSFFVKANSSCLPFKPALATSKSSNALSTASCVASVASNTFLASFNASS